MTASRTCIFASSLLKEYKNDRANLLHSHCHNLRGTLNGNQLRTQCIRILNPQKSLMTENDRDLNDRILGRNKKKTALLVLR